MVLLAEEKMPIRRSEFRKAFWPKVALLVGLVVPSALAVSVARITTIKASLTTPEPAALILLGSGLISVALLIRRFQS